MFCFPVGFQEYLVHSSKYKSFPRQNSLTWTKTFRFNWTIKLVLSPFIYGSLMRHRHTSFSQFEMLKDFSLPALSHFGSRFKLSSFFPHHVASSPPSRLLVAANWQATRWFPLTKSHSNVCRRKAHLEGMVAVVRAQLKPDGTRWRTVGEVKGKHASGVGSQ